MENSQKNYMKGFIPFAIAAALMSLCGGFTAAIPSNITAAWDMTSAVTFITLAYSLGAAALAPIMGKLCDALGRRAALLLALGFYTLGELLIAICPDGNVTLLLIFRFMVGVGAAGIPPVVMGYIMTEFPREKMGKGFTIYMFIANAMVIFGPTLGGLVLAKTGWRPVMWICVAACVITVLLVLFMVKKTEGPKKSLKGFDIGGSIFTLIFFASFLCVPTFGQNNGWGNTITLICIAVAVVSLIILILIEKKQANPILSSKVIFRKNFILPIIVLFLSQGLLQSCMTNIIYFSIMTTGDRTLSGFATSIMYFGMAIGTIVIGPMADKKEPKIVAAIALVFVAVGAAMQMLFTVTTPLWLMCVTLFLVGLGLGGNTTIFMKVALSGLAPEVAGSGSGTYNVFKDMAAPFGVALFCPMFTAGVTAHTATNMAQGMEKAAATAAAAVPSLHSAAIVQVICVIAGIVVCMFLPRVRAKDPKQA